MVLPELTRESSRTRQLLHQPISFHPYLPCALSTVTNPSSTDIPNWIPSTLKIRSAKSSFIIGRIGTKITTEAKPDLQLPAKIWAITDKKSSPFP